VAEYNSGDTLLWKFIDGLSIDEPVCILPHDYGYPLRFKIDVANNNEVYYYQIDGFSYCKKINAKVPGLSRKQEQGFENRR